MKHKNILKNVEGTLLIPVWSRAVETQKLKGLFVDNYALRIYKEIDFDFSAFKKSWKSQLGIAIRTKILDFKVCEFLSENPDGNVIILGAGLDARGLRLDNGRAKWYHIDFQNVIDMREAFFPKSERRVNIASSVLDEKCFDNIDNNNKTLILAEGLFMYLTKEEISILLSRITKKFKNSDILIELLNPKMASNTKKHDSVSNFDVVFKSGFNDSKDLEKLNSNISFVEDWFYLDLYKKKWKIWSIFSMFPNKFKSARIAQYHMF